MDVPNEAASIAAFAKSPTEPWKNIAAVSALSAISAITLLGATPTCFANSTVVSTDE